MDVKISFDKIFCDKNDKTFFPREKDKKCKQKSGHWRKKWQVFDFLGIEKF